MDNSSVFKLDGALIGGLVDKKKVRYKDKFKKQTFGCEDCKTHLGFTLDEMNALFDSILGDAKCTELITEKMFGTSPYRKIPGGIPDLCTRRYTHNRTRVMRPDLEVPSFQRLRLTSRMKDPETDSDESFFKIHFANTAVKLPKEVTNVLPRFSKQSFPDFLSYRDLLAEVFHYKEAERKYSVIHDAVDNWNDGIDRHKVLNLRDRLSYAIYTDTSLKFLKLPPIEQRREKD